MAAARVTVLPAKTWSLRVADVVSVIAPAAAPPALAVSVKAPATVTPAPTEMPPVLLVRVKLLDVVGVVKSIALVMLMAPVFVLPAASPTTTVVAVI